MVNHLKFLQNHQGAECSAIHASFYAELWETWGKICLLNA